MAWVGHAPTETVVDCGNFSAYLTTGRTMPTVLDSYPERREMGVANGAGRRWVRLVGQVGDGCG